MYIFTRKTFYKSKKTPQSLKEKFENTLIKVKKLANSDEYITKEGYLFTKKEYKEILTTKEAIKKYPQYLL